MRDDHSQCPGAEPSSHSWGPLATESQPKQCRQVPGLAQVETFHFPGDLSWGKRILQIQPELPWLQSGTRTPCCITCCCCQEEFGLIHPLHSFVCHGWGAALCLSPHSQNQQPPRLDALIHNPLCSYCGVMAGSPCPLGTAQGQHHHVGTLPAGLVAPACSDAPADPGAALPAQCHRCLRSSRARRRDPNNQRMRGKHHHCKPVRPAGRRGQQGLSHPLLGLSQPGDRGQATATSPGSCCSTESPPSAPACGCRGAPGRPGPRQSPGGSSRGCGCR